LKRLNQTVADTDIVELTNLFRLLSDKTRLNILLLLASGERNVTWLCQQLQLPQPTVSHHLGLLRLNSLLASRRDGKQVFYSLNGRVDRRGDHGLSIRAADYLVGIVQPGHVATLGLVKASA